MRKIHYLVFGLLILGGLGMSALLLPGKGEMAFIQFKEKEYEVARRSYEERLATGDRSVSVVVPLTQLYLQYGDVDKAVALMERFVEENPTNLEALRQLGKFLQYAERPEDYLRILERIGELDPSESTLRLLSRSYNFTEKYDKQITVLKSLVERFPNDPQDFIDLANLQAARGSVAGAEATIRQFESLHANARTPETAELHLRLLLDDKRPQEAFSFAARWIREKPDYDTLTRFADLLHFKGQAALALRLLEPYESAADNYPGLLLKLVELQMANGKSAVVYARLQGLYASRKLPDVAVEPLVDLALAHSETSYAIEVAQECELSILPPWLLANLAESALAEGQKEFLARMVRDLGDDFLVGHPVLGAQLAVARGDAASAAQWLEKAEADSQLPMGQRLALGNLYITLSRPEDALRSYSKVAFEPDAPDAVFVELASLYLETRSAGSGVGVFDSIRKKRRSREIDSGWALVATAAGRGDAVLAWLNTRKLTTVATQELQDVYFAANDAGHRQLAVWTARALYERRHNRKEQVILANALIDAGKPGEALPYLRPLMSAGHATSEEEGMYVAALTAGLQAGEPTGDELKQYWGKRLRDAGLPDSKREEVIYTLLDLKDYSAVLPTIENLARGKNEQWLYAYADISVRSGDKPRLVRFLESELRRTDLTPEGKKLHLQLLIEHGGYGCALSFLRYFVDNGLEEWIPSYEEALTTLNRKADLIAFWKERAAMPSISETERRSLIPRFLEAGEKQPAEALLLPLAANSGPGGADVLQLLYLWGPRPLAPALDWLESRGRSAPGAEKAVWMQVLVNAGAASRAVKLVPADIDPASDPEVFDVYIEALAALKDTVTLGAAITRAAAFDNDSIRLRRLGKVAMENGLTAQARLSLERLIETHPEDRDALKQLGAIALWEGRLSDGRRHLEALLALGGADYESNFYYGEILGHDHDARARTYYQRALDQTNGAKEQTGELKLLRAQILQRLNRVTESQAAFEDLMRQNPADRKLTAEFAAALLQAGRYGDAKRILFQKQ